MLKRELIAVLVKNHKTIKVKDVDLMTRLVFDTMTSALKEGREIELRGFGSFRLRRYDAREARNPGTGERVALQERCGVLFRPGREMLARINYKDD
jgi:integration host factor subunit beta